VFIQSTPTFQGGGTKSAQSPQQREAQQQKTAKLRQKQLAATSDKKAELAVDIEQQTGTINERLMKNNKGKTLDEIQQREATKKRKGVSRGNETPFEIIG
jgi:hypothetical protein